MAGQSEVKNMALFCDFENVALGVRDSKYAKFDISKVLERLCAPQRYRRTLRWRRICGGAARLPGVVWESRR